MVNLKGAFYVLLIIMFSYSTFANVAIQGSELELDKEKNILLVSTNLVNREDKVLADIQLRYEIRRSVDNSLIFSGIEYVSLDSREFKPLKYNLELPELKNEQYSLVQTIYSGSGKLITGLKQDIGLNGSDTGIYFDKNPYLRVYYSSDNMIRYEDSYGQTGKNVFPGDKFDLKFSLKNEYDIDKDVSINYYLLPVLKKGDKKTLGNENLKLALGETKEFNIPLSYEEAGTYDLFVKTSYDDFSFENSVRLVIVGGEGKIIDVFNGQDTYSIGDKMFLDIDLIGAADGMSQVRDVDLKVQILKNGNIIDEKNQKISELEFNPTQHNIVFDVKEELDKYSVKVILSKNDFIYDEVLLNYSDFSGGYYMNERGAIYAENSTCIDDNFCSEDEKSYGNCFDCSVAFQKMQESNKVADKVDTNLNDDEFSTTKNENNTGFSKTLFILAGVFLIFGIISFVAYLVLKKGKNGGKIIGIIMIGLLSSTFLSIDITNADPAAPPPPPPVTTTIQHPVDEFSSIYTDVQDNEDQLDVTGNPPTGDINLGYIEVGGVEYEVSPDGTVYLINEVDRSKVYERNTEVVPFDFIINGRTYTVDSEGNVYYENGYDTGLDLIYNPHLHLRYVIIDGYLVFENGTILAQNGNGIFVIPQSHKIEGSDLWGIGLNGRLYNNNGNLFDVIYYTNINLFSDYVIIGKYLIFENDGTRISKDVNGYFYIPSRFTTTGIGYWAREYNGILILLPNNPYKFTSSEYLKKRFVVIGNYLIFEDGFQVVRGANNFFRIPASYTFSGKEILGSYHNGKFKVYTSEVCGPVFDKTVVNCNEPILEQKIVSNGGSIISQTEYVICGPDNTSWQYVNLDDDWYCPLGKSLAKTHEPGTLDSQFNTFAFSRTIFRDGSDTDVFFNAYVPACVNRIPMMRMQVDIVDNDDNLVKESKVGLYAAHETLEYEANSLGGVLENMDFPEQEEFRKIYTVEMNLKSYRMWSFRERFVESLLRVVNGKDLQIPGAVDLTTLDSRKPHDLGELYLSRDFMLGSFQADLVNNAPVGEDISFEAKFSCDFDVALLEISGVNTAADLDNYIKASESNKNTVMNKLYSNPDICGTHDLESIQNIEYKGVSETTDTERRTLTKTIDVTNLDVANFESVDAFKTYVNSVGDYSDLSSDFRRTNIISKNNPREEIDSFNYINGGGYVFDGQSDSNEKFNVRLNQFGSLGTFNNVSEFESYLEGLSNYDQLTNVLINIGMLSNTQTSKEKVIEFRRINGDDSNNFELEVKVEEKRYTPDTTAEISVNVDSVYPYFGFALVELTSKVTTSTESSWNWRSLQALTLNDLASCLYNWDECLMDERNEGDVSWTLSEVADLGYGPRKDSIAYNWAKQSIDNGDYRDGVVFNEYFDGARGEKTLTANIPVYRSCEGDETWISKSGVYACVNETVYKCHYGLSTDEVIFNLATEAYIGDTLVTYPGTGYACAMGSDGAALWRPIGCYS